MRRPSFRGFMEWLKLRVILSMTSCRGCTISNGLRLLVLVVLDSIPRTVTSYIPPYFRHIIDIVKERFIEGIVFKINDGLFKCVDTSCLVMISQYSEPWMLKHLKLGEGAVFVDVGAHVGKYTILVGKLVGKSGLVIAVEPHPKNYKVLVENVRLNRLENVIALNIAAWSCECDLKLFTGPVGELHSNKINYGLGYITVKARALDDVLDELGVKKVDVIKIDVEGAELEVLKGLTRTLRKYRPKVIVEIWREPARIAGIRQFASQIGYDIHRIDPTYYMLKSKD